MKIRRDGRAKVFLRQAIAFESDECLIWPYSVTGKRGKTGRDGGYGQLKNEDGRNVVAHNVICEKTYGARPTPRHQAAHICGQHLCINKRHLYWATPSQNQADKIVQGRMPDQRGENQPLHKFTNEQVAAIKAELAEGGPHGFQRRLARKYGTNDAAISAIKYGKIWSHIRSNPSG